MRHVSGAVLFAVVLMILGIAIAMLATASAAQEKTENETSPEKMPVTQPASCPMCQLMKNQMHRLKEMQSTLVEAKESAKTEGAADAERRIDRTLRLIEEQHDGLHRMMGWHLENVHPEKEEKLKPGEMFDGMLCPLCKPELHARKTAEPVANFRCPIRGTQLDRTHVPENLTRRWKGRKIGFCSNSAPAVWDQLSEEEKRKRLEKAMEPLSE